MGTKMSSQGQGLLPSLWGHFVPLRFTRPHTHTANCHMDRWIEWSVYVCLSLSKIWHAP